MARGLEVTQGDIKDTGKDIEEIDFALFNLNPLKFLFPLSWEITEIEHLQDQETSKN